jgi:hypothetical protein
LNNINNQNIIVTTGPTEADDDDTKI